MNFKIATYNANSIRSRIANVQNWLSRERPDALCIQETKVQDQDFPQQAFAEVGYHVTYRGQKAYAGVAIATLDEPQDVAFGLDSEPRDEARLIKAQVHEITIVNTYVPQGRSVDSEMFSYKLEWYARFQDYVQPLLAAHKSVIWCGDLNVAPQEIDVHDPKRLANHVDFHPKVREALSRVTKDRLVDVFRVHHTDEPGHYTFWDYRVRGALQRNLGWRVDHIFATPSLAEKSVNSWIDRQARAVEKPSDHTFLVAQFDI
jgi:exodeoxyribonuclease III